MSHSAARLLCDAVAALIAIGAVVVRKIATGKRSIRPRRKLALA